MAGYSVVRNSLLLLFIRKNNRYVHISSKIIGPHSLTLNFIRQNNKCQVLYLTVDENKHQNHHVQLSKRNYFKIVLISQYFSME